MNQLLLLAALPGALLAQALEGTWQGALTESVSFLCMRSASADKGRPV